MKVSTFCPACMLENNSFVGNLFASCKNKNHQSYLVELDDYEFLWIKIKGVTRDLTTVFETNKSQCQQAFSEIQKLKLDSQNAAIEMEDVELLTDEISKKRVRHFLSEKIRNNYAQQALALGDLHTLGRLLNASQTSLKNDFEVVGFEMETLVQIAQEQEGCLGARMMEDVFLDSAIALVQKKRVSLFKTLVRAKCKSILGLAVSFK